MLTEPHPMCVPEEDEDELDVEEHVPSNRFSYPAVEVEEVKEPVVTTPRMFGHPAENGLFGPDIERSLSCLKLETRPYLLAEEVPPFELIDNVTPLVTDTTPLATQTYLDNTEEQISKFFVNDDVSNITFNDQTVQTVEQESQIFKSTQSKTFASNQDT